MNRKFYIKNNVECEEIRGMMFDSYNIIDNDCTFSPIDLIERSVLHGDWACYNFMTRRKDFDLSFKHKLYNIIKNGKHYVVASDEILMIVEDDQLMYTVNMNNYDTVDINDNNKLTSVINDTFRNIMSIDLENGMIKRIKH